jgi:hypothetical protein
MVRARRGELAGLSAVPPEFEIFPLFLAKGFYRLDQRGSHSRDQRGQRGNRQDDSDYTRERRGIGRWDAEEHARKHASCYERERQSTLHAGAVQDDANLSINPALRELMFYSAAQELQSRAFISLDYAVADDQVNPDFFGFHATKLGLVFIRQTWPKSLGDLQWPVPSLALLAAERGR